MRIVSSIILLLVTSALFAQVPQRESSNVEPYRGRVVPYSSLSEVDSVGLEVMRYAIPVSGWQQSNSQDGVTFSSSFDSPFSWIGRQSIISIESASAPYTLWVGGREVGQCLTPSMRVEFNVTRYLKEQAVTPIEIALVDDPTTKELEAWGSDEVAFDLGRVTMLSQPTMYVRDIDLSTTRISGVLNASVSIIVKSEALNPRASRLDYELVSPQGVVVARAQTDLTLDMRREDTLRLFAIIPDSLAWSANNPNLYRLNISTQYRGRYAEYQSINIGLRSLQRSGDGSLMINGEEETFVATSVKSDVTVAELSQLKSEGVNTIKVAAGTYSSALFNAADSIGLYIVATVPINTSKSSASILRGGNPTNDPARKAEYIERTDALYNSVKNHASVVAISLAEANSQNGINLYESYLYLKGLESQRPVIYIDSRGEWNSDQLNIDYR